MLLVVYNLNGSSRMLMMRISDYNNDKGYANNTLLRTNDNKINKEHINNTKAIVKISIKPDDRGKTRVFVIKFPISTLLCYYHVNINET